MRAEVCCSKIERVEWASRILRKNYSRKTTGVRHSELMIIIIGPLSFAARDIAAKIRFAYSRLDSAVSLCKHRAAIR